MTVQFNVNAATGQETIDFQMCAALRVDPKSDFQVGDGVCVVKGFFVLFERADHTRGG